MVMEGASTTLADTQALIAEDTRFPTRAYVAVEKLCGWSVVIDVFHGPNHPVAVSVRHAVHTLSPFLQRLEGQNEDTPGAGVELICRILYDMQQDYFFYLGKLGLGQEAVVPMFEKVLGLVATQRAQVLTPIPTHCPLVHHGWLPEASATGCHLHSCQPLLLPRCGLPPAGSALSTPTRIDALSLGSRTAGTPPSPPWWATGS
jgi:hypothetical protein